MRNVGLALGLVALALFASAQTFTAKVVGVHDGDTITVYDGREQTRSGSMESTARRPVRIFSSRAKQLTSELVFGKQVQFKVKETMLRLPVYATWAYLS